MPGIDEEAIRVLAKLLEETSLSEIEYQTETLKIRVGKGGAFLHAPLPKAVPPKISSSAVSEPSQEDLSGVVTAPMVGTIYLASGPGVAPFIQIGDSVREGQPLLIVEAMKVLNTIRSPHGGIVKRICVIDGQPVEFGDPLVVISP